MTHRIREILTILTVLLCAALPATASGAETAAQVMKRASALLQRASGIQASFTMNVGGRSMKGTLKSSAAGFALSTSAFTTWYNGKDMWTYNASSVETTVTRPTATEVRESNPLLMVAQYENAFTAAFSKTQKQGAYVIVLTPKDKKTGFKSVVVTLGKGNYQPKSITVNPRSGASTTVSITSLSTAARFSAADFTYPKAKYPKAEIIDLR